jgi:transposase
VEAPLDIDYVHPSLKEVVMATERVSMRRAREILRLKWCEGLSHRAIAASLGVSPGTVSATAARAASCGLDWASVEGMPERALEARLYPQAAAGDARAEPDMVWIHTELRRPGVTLELLHLEYLERHPGGYRMTAFGERYRAWLKRCRPSMRQVHRAGEKIFVDYSGKRPSIVEPETGESVPVELFVAVLGASNYTYAEASATQQVADWIGSHVRAFEFFEGASAVLVPDQLKSGVSVSCRYEPGVQRTYAELATHYGAVVVPARPRKPRDKPKVEVAVQIVQRWILARLRNERFTSLAALNERIRALCVQLNERPMKTYGGRSRRDLYVQLDRPALKPLPTERFELAEWKMAKLNIDYHFELQRHLYSAPHALIHETLDIRFTATTVEAFCRGERVASHRRSDEPGRHTTLAEHMPAAHQKHLEWSPSRIIRWAGTIGPETAALVTAIMETRPHPEQGYRSCLGILRLARRHGETRLEAACARALRANARSYRHVESILKHGLDRQPLLPMPEETPAEPRTHENVRGPGYYQ